MVYTSPSDLGICSERVISIVLRSGRIIWVVSTISLHRVTPSNSQTLPYFRAIPT